LKLLVTGGAGLIGSHVVDAYVEAGHDVVVVDDLSTGRRANLNPAAKFFEMSILDDDLAKVFDTERPDLVSHQAARASVQESLRDPVGYARTNVIGSLNVLESCRRSDVRKVIYASTGGAGYGEPQWLPVTEDHPMNPLDPYGASKHHVEHYLSAYRRNFGIDFTILRYPNVFGPRQDPDGEAGVVAIFIRQMLEGVQPVITGDGEQTRDFVYASDVAAANVLCVRAPEGRTYNLGTGSGTTVNEVFQSIRSVLGVEPPEVHGPAKSGEVRHIALDASLIERERDWRPAVTLAEGLRATVDFFRDSKRGQPSPDASKGGERQRQPTA